MAKMAQPDPSEREGTEWHMSGQLGYGVEVIVPVWHGHNSGTFSFPQ